MLHSRIELRNSSVKIATLSIQLLQFPQLRKTSVIVASDFPNSRWMNFVVTARKRSVRRLCLHRYVSVGFSVRGLCPGGSLSRGFSVQGGLCPGESLSGGSLSRRVSVQGVSVKGISVQGSLSRIPPPQTEAPSHTVTSGWFASYWNAFLFFRVQSKFS